MNVVIEKTVRELALENPAATRVFEKLGIDYCCGGNKSLEAACHSANVNIDAVLESLEKASQANPTPPRDWQVEPIAALIAHIKDTHHKFTREEILRLNPLFTKVCAAHGKNHPELFQIQSLFQDLANELSAHLMKEEMVLFPYLIRLEAAVTGKEPVARAPFGSVRIPISMMESEHDSAGCILRAIKGITQGYSAPPDVCVSYHTLYKALAAFEADLHQHIHLENNVLFPRAVELENANCAK